MMSFLGMAYFSKNYLSDYTTVAAPLRKLISTAGRRHLHLPPTLTAESEEASVRLKQLLSYVSELASPDLRRMFHLDVIESEGFLTSVFWKPVVIQKKVLCYYLTKLDPAAKGDPPVQTPCAPLLKL